MPLNNPYCEVAFIEVGQSTSISAKSGVDVVFSEECSETPRVLVSPHQESKVWLTEILTTGFTWQSDEDISTVDWVAIVRNG